MATHDSATVWSRRRVLASLLGVGALAPFVRGERGDTGDSVLLRYTAHVPNSHGLYSKVFVPWSAMVTEQTGGRIRWEHYVDALLHGALDGFKAVASGVTDYTHGYATYQPGSFHLTHGLQLPFLFANSGVAALVSEELYPEYLKDEYERMGVYLAHCDSTTAYDIMSKRPVREPADMRGLKIRSTGGLMAEILRQVGAVPVVLAAAETYTAFQRGVIDGVALGAPDMVAYRLYETGTHYLRVGLTHTVIQFCLNPRTFDELPGDLRVQLYNLYRLHGQVASRNFYGGENLDIAIETLRAEGIEVTEQTPTERQAWVDAVQPLEQRFIDENERRGLPATAFVREAKERAALYANWTDQQLWDYASANPVQGIIAL
ncbi:MAG TPA: TRAP transporter substrate-binding protein DctP [Vicinamibacterales bacterium]|nr:TRAP transporter substrate-binding protein DctP [Vicinamibacterales bacterium]